jgi:5S rRNA maturation endonuclease (ribonuclease M5)
MSRALDRVRDALERVTEIDPHGDTGDKLRARCPAHMGQSTTSLAVASVEGQTLVYCHAGCDTAAVLAALALTKTDLFDNPRGVEYRYDDGRTVHRAPDKTFRQSGDTSGTALYRLAAVKQAVADSRPVYVTEGEKDVHALESLGVVATCSAMGAGKASKADWSPLAGATVHVIADHDTPGLRHARGVADHLTGLQATVQLWQAKTGKDAADHVAAGYGLDELVSLDVQTEAPEPRRVRLTPASAIKPRPVYWVWADRLPLGEVCLTPGRGGVGKSTFHAWVIAHLTRGTLTGAWRGTPKACVVAAAEDSWARTIVPRLIAAGANLELVYRADVITDEGAELSVTLPADCAGLADQIDSVGAALVSLDPLMSTVSTSLDTHKDRDVRAALEPLARLADQTGATILGNAHFRKTSSDDPLMMAMGSAAFGNVVRAALGFAADVDDDGQPTGTCVISQIKNNLGRLDQPHLEYRIEETAVPTDEGEARIGRFVLTGETDRSVGDILGRNGNGHGEKEDSALGEAAEWLLDHLSQNENGRAARKTVVAAAKEAGFSERTMERAKVEANAGHEIGGFPRSSLWVHPLSRAKGSSEADHANGFGATGGTTGDLREQNDHGCETLSGANGGAWGSDCGATAAPLAVSTDLDATDSDQAADLLGDLTGEEAS